MTKNSDIIKVPYKRYENITKEVEAVLSQKEDPIFIAIDGKCASGKTTLGAYLKELFDCNLFHLDDFFLQREQRTEERLHEVGGNVDYERFRMEVITPIQDKRSVIYRPFQCSNMKIMEGTVIPYKRLNIMEGTYSQHPYFKEIYQLRIFMDIDEKEQTDRIRLRNGEERLERFLTEWIPKENAYFREFHIREKSQFCLSHDFL